MRKSQSDRRWKAILIQNEDSTRYDDFIEEMVAHLIDIGELSISASSGYDEYDSPTLVWTATGECVFSRRNG